MAAQTLVALSLHSPVSSAWRGRRRKEGRKESRSFHPWSWALPWTPAWEQGSITLPGPVRMELGWDPDLHREIWEEMPAHAQKKDLCFPPESLFSWYYLKYLHWKEIIFQTPGFLGEQDNYFKNIFGGEKCTHTVCQGESLVTFMKYEILKDFNIFQHRNLINRHRFVFINEAILSKAVVPAVCWGWEFRYL